MNFPAQAVLDKLPENRTPEDIQKLVPLVSQVGARPRLLQGMLPPSKLSCLLLRP